VEESTKNEDCLAPRRERQRFPVIAAKHSSQTLGEPLSKGDFNKNYKENKQVNKTACRAEITP
jgi:hypothetical protein